MHVEITPLRFSLTEVEKKIPAQRKASCIKGESNPRRVDGNDPGYHYPINAICKTVTFNVSMFITDEEQHGYVPARLVTSLTLHDAPSVCKVISERRGQVFLREG